MADELQTENEYLKQFIPEVHFELIPIRNLLSNQDYHRRLQNTKTRINTGYFSLQNKTTPH